MTKWEYKIVYIQAAKWTKTGMPEELNQQFDQWGADGWELIKVEPILSGGWFSIFRRDSCFCCIFQTAQRVVHRSGRLFR